MTRKEFYQYCLIEIIRTIITNQYSYSISINSKYVIILLNAINDSFGQSLYIDKNSYFKRYVILNIGKDHEGRILFSMLHDDRNAWVDLDMDLQYAKEVGNMIEPLVEIDL